MDQIVGDYLPAGDPYAVSVSLPTWKDTIAWARRDPELLARLKTGYPRFFIPPVVKELASKLVELAEPALLPAHKDLQDDGSITPASQTYQALLFQCSSYAKECQAYLQSVCSYEQHPFPIIHVNIAGHIQVIDGIDVHIGCTHRDLYAVVYPSKLSAEAVAFWQHTGFGISSRCAVHWLEQAPLFRQQGVSKLAFVKELLLAKSDEPKMAIRKRIADSLCTSLTDVSAEDVFLYSTGMSAIASTATALHKLRGNDATVCKVAVFGFLYVDTFKVLSKIRKFECILYGHASPSELDTLESHLSEGMKIDALYTEFPGNPLLSSPDLERLHHLSIQHDFLLVVDDTIATSINVALFPYCDIICTSLTKMWSGACNVMGGSATLNRHSQRYSVLHKVLLEEYVDTYFPLDAMVMELNSQDVTTRVLKASENAEMVVGMLKNHRAVVEVFYPKGSTSQHIYESFMRSDGRYGFLLSIRFVKPACAIAFHDALDVAKGPSLGTNFTLCCAYTLLAHYKELEWAASFGVVEHLVRISVGVESVELLDGLIRKALDAAERELAVDSPLLS